MSRMRHLIGNPRSYKRCDVRRNRCPRGNIRRLIGIASNICGGKILGQTITTHVIEIENGKCYSCSARRYRSPSHKIVVSTYTSGIYWSGYIVTISRITSGIIIYIGHCHGNILSRIRTLIIPLCVVTSLGIVASLRVIPSFGVVGPLVVSLRITLPCVVLEYATRSGNHRTPFFSFG